MVLPNFTQNNSKHHDDAHEKIDLNITGHCTQISFLYRNHRA